MISYAITCNIRSKMALRWPQLVRWMFNASNLTRIENATITYLSLIYLSNAHQTREHIITFNTSVRSNTEFRIYFIASRGANLLRRRIRYLSARSVASAPSRRRSIVFIGAHARASRGLLKSPCLWYTVYSVVDTTVQAHGHPAIFAVERSRLACSPGRSTSNRLTFPTECQIDT